MKKILWVALGLVFLVGSILPSACSQETYLTPYTPTTTYIPQASTKVYSTFTPQNTTSKPASSSYTSITTSSTTSQNSSQTKLYTNKSIGFSIQIPTNWAIGDDYPYSVIRETGFWVEIHFYVGNASWQKNMHIYTPEQYVNYLQDTHAISLVSKPRSFVFSGYPAYEATWAAVESMHRTAETHCIVVQRGGDLILVESMLYSEIYRADVDLAMASLKLN